MSIDRARMVKIDPAALPVVASGYSQDAVMADLRGHGFSGQVMRPYSMTMLGDELGRVLHLRDGNDTASNRSC